MSKFLMFVAAAVAVVGFSVSTVMARGGGGGHGGGGHHGAGHHSSHHNSHHSSHHSNHHASHHHNGHHSHYHHSHWANHNRPFSHGWYGRHGGNWGYGWGGWGWGNPWGVATLGAAAGWIGADGLYNNWGNYGYGEPADVLTADNADDTDTDADDDNADNNNQQVANNENAEQLEQEPAAQAAAAAALARNGQTDPPKQTAFLPLGVFTLAPEGQREANALVQLALSKDGTLRGTYYDLLSDRDQQIRGSVDKQTGRAAFTFGQQGKITFETTLGNLTRESGTVGVHYENGKKSTWTLARYAKEPTDEAKEGTEVQTGAKNPTGEKPIEIPVEVEPDTDPAAPAQR